MDCSCAFSTLIGMEAAVSRHTGRQARGPTHALVFYPQNEKCFRLLLVQNKTSKNWMPPESHLLDTWGLLTDAERATPRTTGGYSPPFYLIAATERLPPRMCWMLAIEMNEVAERIIAGNAEQTLARLIAIFSSKLCRGVAFVRDMSALSSLPPPAEAVVKVQSLKVLVTTQNDEVQRAIQRLESKVEKSLVRSEDAAYAELAVGLKDTTFPFPFSSTDECEVFLQSELNYKVAMTAFQNYRAVTAEKRSVCITKFKANIVIDFLFELSINFG